MTTLLVALPPAWLSQEQVKRLSAAAGDMRVETAHTANQIEPLLDDIELAAGFFPPDLLDRAPKLRWLQYWGTGVDWLMRHPTLTIPNCPTR